MPVLEQAERVAYLRVVPATLAYATAKALHENGSLCFYNESFTVLRKHY